jgi:Skp family chaperone for outer membrane proteins
MAVQSESLEVLEKADVAPALARAIVRAIEIEIAGATDTLATKHDLLVLRHDVFAELAKMRSEMVEVRAEFQAANASLRAHFQAANADLRADFQTTNADLRAEFQTANADLRGELRAEIHSAVSGVARQMYVAMIGQTAVMLGFTYFLVTQLR